MSSDSTGFKDLLTIGPAAEAIGVHPDTLRNWDRSGKLAAHRHPINGYRLYSPDELQQLSLEIAQSTGATS